MQDSSAMTSSVTPLLLAANGQVAKAIVGFLVIVALVFFIRVMLARIKNG